MPFTVFGTLGAFTQNPAFTIAAFGVSLIIAGLVDYPLQSNRSRREQP